MANWFTSIFSSGVSNLVDSVGNTIDKLVTSDEERLQLKNELEKELNSFRNSQLKHTEELETQVTERHKSDMQSDSWLSKNIRPAMLAFLTCAVVVFMYLTTFGTLTQLQLDALKTWQPLLQVLLTTTYGFYFGGRSIEKFMNRKKDK